MRAFARMVRKLQYYLQSVGMLPKCAEHFCLFISKVTQNVASDFLPLPLSATASRFGL